MDRNWLLGFIEAQGCFSVVIKRNNSYKQVTPSFSIKMPLADRELAQAIKTEIGDAGNLYPDRTSITLKATKLEGVGKIAEMLDWMSFQSKKKRAEFDIWKNCIQMIKDKKHLTKEGFLKIAMLRDLMQKKNSSNKVKFCGIHNEIEPCPEYKKRNKVPQNCTKCLTK